MSAPHFAWAFEVGIKYDLPTSARMVLIALAERANGVRECWPSLPRISKDTGLSERSAHTWVHFLANHEPALVRMQQRGREMHYFILRPGETGVKSRETVAEQPPEAPLQDLQGTPAETLANPAPDPCKSCTGTLATVASESLKKNPLRESPKEGTRGEAPRRETPDIIRDLFTEGLPLLIGLTGQSEPRCRAMIGRLRKEAGDDCSRVLAALHRAGDVRPTDPFPWLLQSVRTKPQLGVIDQIRHDWNLPTFLTPVIDDDDPEPPVYEPARIAP